ncbi:MAG: low molecular weight phosphotyrosine protein phosphatase [Gammaproteobacteria bacterium]|nr:low molecular weight phosphotyrosine protein phosphatase [Gammaproteobacteria bacterium]
MTKKVGVLFVCLGNICRSPTAEGIFRKLVRERELDQHIHIDSAGTGAWHVGSPPDNRAQQAAARRDVDISGLRGRQVERDDFDRFDYVIAMDRSNLQDLRSLARGRTEHIELLLSYAHNWSEQDVPDPYYGGPAGFERVLDMIEDAANGLLRDIEDRLGNAVDSR